MVCGSSILESKNYDEYVKIKNENEKLKKDLEKLSTTNTIVIENLDHDSDCRRTDQFIRIQVQWQSASGRTVILEPI